MKVLKAIYFIFVSALFLYMIWPFSPRGISDFSPLPQSAKSTLSGDTTEVANVSAYFSNHYRKFVTDYYRFIYQSQTKLFLAPIRLNYPPEEAYQYIKDQTHSTYLEEYVYPLRDSLFINGLEPFDEISKNERYSGATRFMENGQLWETKTTLRFYPSTLVIKFLVWIFIAVSLYICYSAVKRLIKV